MSRILNYGQPGQVHEDDICGEADRNDGHVALAHVVAHLELIAQVPNDTGDALAARGALAAITELANRVGVSLDELTVQVRP